MSVHSILIYLRHPPQKNTWGARLAIQLTMDALIQPIFMRMYYTRSSDSTTLLDPKRESECSLGEQMVSTFLSGSK